MSTESGGPARRAYKPSTIEAVHALVAQRLFTATGTCYLPEHPTHRRAVHTRSASKMQADRQSGGGGSGNDDKNVVIRVKEPPTDATHCMTVINVDAVDVGGSS